MRVGGRKGTPEGTRAGEEGQRELADTYRIYFLIFVILV
jgi:hypothetical protein